MSGPGGGNARLVIAPASKLSMTRRFSQTTWPMFGWARSRRWSCSRTMDGRLERQERIETTSARTFTAVCGHDLSSSYFEALLARWPRWGITATSRASCRSTGGWVCLASGGGRCRCRCTRGTPRTVPDVIDTIKERFGIERVILVGDWGDDHRRACTLKRTRRVRLGAEDRADPEAIGQASCSSCLFDQTNLAEISSEEFPGERLVVCRNPHLAAERARETRGPRHRARARQGQADGRPTARHAASGPDAGKIGERAGRATTSTRIANFELQIADRSLDERKTEQIDEELRLMGSTYSEPPAPPTSSPPKQ